MYRCHDALIEKIIETFFAATAVVLKRKFYYTPNYTY